MPQSPDGVTTHTVIFDSISLTLFDAETCSRAGNSGSGGANLGFPGSNIYNGQLSGVAHIFDSSGGATSKRLSMASRQTLVSCRTITQLSSV